MAGVSGTTCSTTSNRRLVHRGCALHCRRAQLLVLSVRGHSQLSSYLGAMGAPQSPGAKTGLRRTRPEITQFGATTEAVRDTQPKRRAHSFVWRQPFLMSFPLGSRVCFHDSARRANGSRISFRPRTVVKVCFPCLRQEKVFDLQLCFLPVYILYGAWQCFWTWDTTPAPDLVVYGIFS